MRRIEEPRRSEMIASISQWWSDPEITTQAMGDSLGISLFLIRKLAREVGLPDRRAAGYHPRMKVKIRDLTFENYDEAAKHFGVHATTVTGAVMRGRADSVGIGAGRHKNRKGGTRRPFVLGRYQWPTQVAAASALGMSYRYLHRLVKDGRTDILMARVMAHSARIGRGAVA